MLGKPLTIAPEVLVRIRRPTLPSPHIQTPQMTQKHRNAHMHPYMYVHSSRMPSHTPSHAQNIHRPTTQHRHTPSTQPHTQQVHTTRVTHTRSATALSLTAIRGNWPSVFPTVASWKNENRMSSSCVMRQKRSYMATHSFTVRCWGRDTGTTLNNIGRKTWSDNGAVRGHWQHK